MNSLDIRRLVHRVIGGKEGLPPMSFPHDPKAAEMLVRHTEVFINFAGALTHAQRVQFIRKTAAYINRRRLDATLEICLVYGSLWFHCHPQLLTTRLSFGGALRHRMRDHATTLRRSRRDSAEALDRALAKPAPPKPVILSRCDHLLEQCTHVSHVLELGIEAGNCLVFQDGHSAWPNPRYWHSVRDGHGHLFNVRHAKRLTAILFIDRNELVDAEAFQPRETLQPLMANFFAAIEQVIGPVTNNHSNCWWHPHVPKPLPEPHDPAQMTFFQEDAA